MSNIAVYSSRPGQHAALNVDFKGEDEDVRYRDMGYAPSGATATATSRAALESERLAKTPPSTAKEEGPN